MRYAETAAFLNQKGGVGKTTCVVNVGAGLSILGKKVLIVDLDPQGHLTRFLGITNDEIKKTVYDVLRGETPPREAIIKRTLRAKLMIDGRNFELSMAILPSTIELSEAETILTYSEDREFLLRNALANLKSDYDYVLLDCPPSVGLVSTNALAASDKVFIPVQTEFLALESLDTLMQKIDSITQNLNLDLEIGGLIATRFDRRKVLSRTVVQELRERYGILLLDTMIRENIVLAESPRYGKDIFSYRPRSFGTQDYLNLSLEIMGRIDDADSLFSVERGVIKGQRDSEDPVAPLP